MSTTAEDRSPGHMLCTSSGTSQALQNDQESCLECFRTGRPVMVSDPGQVRLTW
jgi:hypothetical protein